MIACLPIRCDLGQIRDKKSGRDDTQRYHACVVSSSIQKTSSHETMPSSVAPQKDQYRLSKWACLQRNFIDTHFVLVMLERNARANLALKQAENTSFKPPSNLHFPPFSFRSSLRHRATRHLPGLSLTSLRRPLAKSSNELSAEARAIMAQPDISQILAALGGTSLPRRSSSMPKLTSNTAQQPPSATPQQPTPHPPPSYAPGAVPGQPPSAPPPAQSYLPQPSSTGSVDLSAIKPVNSGSVSIADAIAKAKSIAADRGVPSFDPRSGEYFQSARVRLNTYVYSYSTRRLTTAWPWLPGLPFPIAFSAKRGCVQQQSVPRRAPGGPEERELSQVTITGSQLPRFERSASRLSLE